MMQQVVIVGAGQAGAAAAAKLRALGYAGSITLIGAEAAPPYQRPPLSKKYLAGELGLDRLQLRQPSYFDEQRVELRLGRRATAIDRHAKQVQLVGGATLDYEHLIIATGSHPRRLKMPGADLAGVHYLRSLSDADHLRTEVHVGQRAVIIGGGYIGLEVAATLRQLGMEVTVLEMADRVMNRVVAEPVSRYYEREHASHGVKIELDVGVLALQGDTNGRVCAVETNRGAIAANLVVVGIGVLPTDELAQNAGLACDNGIVVDEYCRTSDQAIFAIGDCSNHPSAHYGRRVRLESVDNAFEQANTVATNITGTPTKHDRVPWFWSDQYHHKLLIVGLADGHDQAILRGDQATHSFSVCYLRDGEFIAIDTVNMAKDQMAARKLIASRMRPDPNKLADISIALKDCG